MTARATTDDDRTVGTRIMKLRKAKGISRSALGAAISVTFQQVLKYEKGLNRVGAGRLHEIAKHLEVPVSALFDEGGEEGTSEMFDLKVEAGAIELLKAYAAIEDVDLRRNVLAIVRTAVHLGHGPKAISA
ncbi:hypothetical protein ASG40_12810 [Methylobacterium sp. Leaf399]|uniref:helix-turn-helix domain-containing protein n=1 Tax=unclassified Methylobacterium TaxID=2615210 RepID=UPI0006FD3BF4|nr:MULTISPECIES: helix-turn-helix transcriptional regulator [unclassified Methylobacterium]KQP50805.1 hypothetical protein ASF39_11190 [Methylobacterium sp. Leaf108]KQT07785.1 hypothetical protein ASG40_12810 [Methylobacterium sp. Leaf399]